jgi:endonuclease YncB( thermonuclease family)
MTAPYFLALSGKFIVLGKNPDGDSVRFVADEPKHYHLLYKGYKVKRSEDGSVQLRLEGIDAPELHYGKLAQPLGEEARDALLQLIGFGEVEYDSTRHVVRATRSEVRGFILTRGIDNHGRPISYIVTGSADTNLKNGDWHFVDKELLQQSVNVQMLLRGYVYYLVYTATPYIHRVYLRQVAEEARQARLGVWGRDVTPYFRLGNLSSLNRGGQLIFPKFFRRCTDYLKARHSGFDGELSDWLMRYSKGSRIENDRVVIQDTIEIWLSDLVEQYNSHVSIQGDLLDFVFVEK